MYIAAEYVDDESISVTAVANSVMTESKTVLELLLETELAESVAEKRKGQLQ